MLAGALACFSDFCCCNFCFPAASRQLRQAWALPFGPQTLLHSVPVIVLPGFFVVPFGAFVTVSGGGPTVTLRPPLLAGGVTGAKLGPDSGGPPGSLTAVCLLGSAWENETEFIGR